MATPHADPPRPERRASHPPAEVVCPRVWWDAALVDAFRNRTEGRILDRCLHIDPTSREVVRLLARPAAVQTPHRLTLHLQDQGPASDARFPVAGVASGSEQPGWQVDLVLTADADGEHRLQGQALDPDGHTRSLSLVLPGAEQRVLRFDSVDDASEGTRPKDQDAALAAIRWSRTRGALGDAVWQQLCRAHVALVGCGRTGSLLAEALAGLGLQRLTLIDPDYLELHNLGEGAGYGTAHLGHAKATALADTLEARYDDLQVTAIAQGIAGWRAAGAVRSADVVLAAPDHDAARFVASALAVAHHRPLLDLGTGIQVRRPPHAPGSAEPQAPALDLGADIRLFMPGDGCVLCWGGLADPDAVRARLRGERSTSRDWRAQRAGSLRSLNTTAVGVALRLLEDLYRGEVRHSQHVQLRWEGGTPRMEHRERSQRVRSQCLCHYAGAATGADRAVRAWVRTGHFDG